MDMPVPHTEIVRQMARETSDLMDRLDTFRPLIEEGMRHGTYTHSFDDLVKMVVERKIHPKFWDDAFALIAIHEYPQARHFHIFLAGGSLRTLMAAKDELIQNARDANCNRMTVNGRPGWARVLRAMGAEHKYTMLAMEVPQDGQE